MRQISLIVNGKSIFVQTKYVLSYYTNIVAKKINLYKLALENIIPGSSRLIVNMDFINNDMLELSVMKITAKSPEIDEKGTLWARGLIERMRKIKDNVLKSLNILAKDVKEEFAPGSKKIPLMIFRTGYINIGGLSTQKITLVNQILRDTELDILEIAETWGNDINSSIETARL
ncbi:hypothetical protein CWI36_1200p0010 [Hamiltosporidium magnivora]|uniref:Uncharacterized protein n=1 Tax=Hamiltosporidium magnivora TaxID=148818 RepID=A0A4Q9L3G1_9MICR|nr:hypothetical protein CWI36_1200p0010 [Hamiltosporidium magnivora]